MYLKRLELSGFKSFGKKTVLDFTSPVTAIVGPNGSGKSNVVEAIRFVLGEQSIKSMRGKSGTDLIFKGSKGLSAPSRASVGIVFDNRKKIFSFANNSSGLPNIAFDEITLSREVYSDGVNRYSINGSEVRLKDILELLASVHIGSSGHHMISQGEADRVLNASSKDRRSMIEDALGLRVYQYKLRESERKLERTLANMKEVGSLRRELSPHITFLSKQVEKIEKAKELRMELQGLYTTYFANEEYYITTEKAAIEKERVEHEIEAKKITEALGSVEVPAVAPTDASVARDIATLEEKIFALKKKRDDTSRNLGRLEGVLEALTVKKDAPQKQTMIPKEEVEVLIGELEAMIAEAIEAASLSDAIPILRNVREKLVFFQKVDVAQSETTEDSEHIQNVEGSIKELIRALEVYDEEYVAYERELQKLQNATLLHERALRESERESYELKAKQNAINAKLEMLRLRKDVLETVTTAYANEQQEARVLVGAPEHINKGEAVERSVQEDLRKRIERIKIKIEDAGGGSGSDVLKEYESIKERDQFLARELGDLEVSINELKRLIAELKEKLDTEFKAGILKINKQFQEFFALMFGGGSAFLAIVVEHKRKSKEEDEEEMSADGELAFERGIEINVSLPHKKVKDLNMLSGGERSLTSIALLFAMSQVNPPPFLVLDETDAALDEANSKKYGNMIESLSKYSELIVVTHNRETMSRADVLYGVTIGSDGASKLLSIKFDEAVQIAK
jgi:chromosome segregation protein